MNDPLIARFADACGAAGPLDLRVDLAGGSVLAEGTVNQPFTLVGRDDACDVTLSDPEVNMRHAWLQVLGGRVFAVDLGSRTGLTWPSSSQGSGWLDVGTPVKLGPFLIHLRSPVSEKPGSYPPGYNPLSTDPGAKARSAVTLEFRNGRRAKDRWKLNRLITLIGRASDCKIHLNAEDISPYHCGIVSTRTGLWVVDLSGRGVVVNGERMRVSPLQQGAELWIGRFLIGCQYQTPPSPPTAPASRSSSEKSGRLAPAAQQAANNRTALSFSHVAVPGDASILTTPAPLVSSTVAPREDEVELGGTPDTGGLPASHIMADAFRERSSSSTDSLSNPILVSGSGPKPPAPLLASSAAAPALSAADEVSLTPLLRQMADLHGRTAAEHQQSQSLVAQLFSRVKREHLAVLQHELSRIQELTAEITALQLEAARQTLDQAATDRARQFAPPAPPEARPSDWVPPSTRTPLPDTPLLPPLHTAERLAMLQRDCAARWQALLVLFAGM